MSTDAAVQGAELDLIGAALQDAAVTTKVTVAAEQFDDPVRGRVWEVIGHIHGEGLVPVPTLIMERVLPFRVDAAIFPDLAVRGEPVNCEAYADIIVKAHRRRSVIEALTTARMRINKGGDIDCELASIASAAGDADTSGVPVGLNAFRLDWHTVWAGAKPQEWIAEPVIPARRLIALYSPPKLGKSLLMLELAAAIATGGIMFGQPVQRRRVLYVDFENDPDQDIRVRLQAMGYAPGQLDDLVYLSFPMLGDLDRPGGGEALIAYAVQQECAAVIVDTVSRTITGGENDNDTWLGFYRFTGLLAKRAGLSLIRLDHSGKDWTKGMRGGSAKAGDVDAVWSLSQGGDEHSFRLTCDMARYPATKELVLGRRSNPLRHELIASSDSPGAAPLVAKLDELGVDPHWGATRAGRALRDAGVKGGSDDILAAQRARRLAAHSGGESHPDGSDEEDRP